MSSRLVRTLRISRKLLLPLAAVPLLQTTGCDPASLAVQYGASIATQLLQQVAFSAASSFVTLLIQTFPGADLLRLALGFSGS